MKKKLLTVLLVVSTFCLCFGLAACGTEHTHTYAESWSYDATYHWHAATCEHIDEVSDKAEHTWDNGVVTTAATCTEDGVKTFTCTVCSATKTEPVIAAGHDYSTNWYSNATNHFHKCTKCDVITDEAGHTYGEWNYDSTSSKCMRACSVCNYVDTVNVAESGVVASIGETCYTTLEDAVAAATNGDTVTLLADTELDANLSITTNITIDLGSKTLTFGQNCSRGISVTNSATVTVKNGTVKGYQTALYVGEANDTSDTVSTLTLDNVTVNETATGTTTNALVYINGYSKLILNANSTLEANNCAVLTVWDYATVDVYGTVKSADNFAIATNGTWSVNVQVNIYEGAMVESTNDVAVYIPRGNLTITGGAITGKNSAVEIRAGSLTISGGTLTSTATEFAATANGNGPTVSGAALAISQHTTNLAIKVEVSGGIFAGIYAVYETDLQDNTTEGITISLTSGTYTGSVYSENVTGFISGGTYSDLPDYTYFAEGYIATANGDGTYGVTTGTYVAHIGSVGYTTLEDAVAAATNGDTIVLLSDVTLTEAITVSSTITFDLNGHTLSNSSTSSSAYVISVASGTSLTLFGGEIKSESGKGIEVNGELTLDNVKVTTKYNAVSCSNGSTATITNSTIESTYSTNKGVSYNNVTTVSITNSTIKSATGNAVGGSGKDATNRATLTIDNSTLTSGTTSTVVSALMYVDATVTNSTITCTSSSGTALGAGNGSVLTAKNCTITAVATAVSATANGSNPATLTVEGCTLTTTGSEGNTVKTNYGTVNLKDCDIISNYAGVLLNNCSTVNITDGTTIDAQYGVYSSGNNNVINISDTKINVKGTESSGCFGIYHNGSYAPVTVSVTDSEIYAEEGEYMGHGIYISNSASSESKQTLTVSGCTIQGSTAVEVKHTNVTISNSTLTAIGEQKTQANGNGVCTSGYALAMTSNSSDEAATGTVTLSGNTFSNTNNSVSETANLIFNASNGATISGYEGTVDSSYAA